jgi:thioredoxin-like negative regulator of GroEL
MTDLSMPTIILFYDKYDAETLKVFEQVKATLNGRAVLIRLNVNRHPASFATFKVEELPAMVAFLSGKELWRVSGNLTEESILQNFENISL